MFQLVFVVSHLIITHNQKESGYIFSVSSDQIVADNKNIPPLLSLLKAEQAQDSDSAHMPCSPALWPS